MLKVIAVQLQLVTLLLSGLLPAGAGELYRLPTPTPAPEALEGVDFIARRQYPEIYPPKTLLPDLRSLRPADFKIVVDLAQDHRYLHFSTAFWNRGPGVVELQGREQAGEPLLRVTQLVFRADGSHQPLPAGFFEFEEEHGHWHWENFSRYELWTVSEGGLEELVAVNDKVGFCLRDVRVYRGNPEHIRLPSGQADVGELVYDSCFWERQGLSVGWLDIYRNNIPGQFVEISGLPDGLYALKTTIDPGNTILELDEENNAAVRYIVLENNQVRSLSAEYIPTFRNIAFE